MIYLFEGHTLDTDTLELCAGGEPVALEPQEFALLLLLVENRERVLSRDEIIEKVWEGRVVSDSAMSSRIKTLRRALGDDGAAQRLIRTVHGRGFRFVAQTRFAAAPAGDMLTPSMESPLLTPLPRAGGKPSIAVLPFELLGHVEPYGVLADALPHELIAALSRLRWLVVIARGSSFRFRGSAPDMQELGRLLAARYCLSGAIEILGRMVAVTVELADTRSGAVIWSERYTCALDGVHDVRMQIVANVVTTLEIRIPLHEAAAIQNNVSEDLDAWAAYHLGLQHMYRFNREDNARATARFEQAIARDPGFARAYAGLSFTHFQTAFMRYNADPAAAATYARAQAERGLELDPLDPFVNFTLGRSYWLTGDLEMSMMWLERATTLSPNYAQGLYARAWTEAIAGRGADGRIHVDEAMALSPLDPLLYAMRATRALSLIVEGEVQAAVPWAEQAARTPGAHVLIVVVAVVANVLAGNTERAAALVAHARERRPDLNTAHFLQAFPFVQQNLHQRIAAALAGCGL